MSDHKHHIMPLKVYVSVFACLLVLTVVTVWVSLFDFGKLNMWIAMFVASIKAGLVAMYFMQLKYDNRLYLYILLAGFAFLALLLGVTVFDISTRVMQSSTL